MNMPNTFIDNRDAWLRLSEIDYIGQFVKTWLAFNAWYRSAYTETQDRKIINEIKLLPNPVSNKFRPLLEANSDEANQFRSEISLLHHRLENYDIQTGKGDEKQRITLTNVFLKDKPATSITETHYQRIFSLQRQNNGHVTVEVKKTDGTIVFSKNQIRYDLNDVQMDLGYAALSQNHQSYLRAKYLSISPREVANLLIGPSAPIVCGAHTFRATREDLFAGVVEAIYLMRCTLFHGELSPTRDATACYEPAYRIIRRFLDAIN
jgi:hypothetical protein